MEKNYEYWLSKFNHNRLQLKDVCKVLKKPSYSTMSKLFAELGDQKIIDDEILPKFKWINGARIWKLEDVIEFENKRWS